MSTLLHKPVITLESPLDTLLGTNLLVGTPVSPYERNESAAFRTTPRGSKYIR